MRLFRQRGFIIVTLGIAFIGLLHSFPILENDWRKMEGRLATSVAINRLNRSDTAVSGKSADRGKLHVNRTMIVDYLPWEIASISFRDNDTATLLASKRDEEARFQNKGQRVPGDLSNEIARLRNKHKGGLCEPPFKETKNCCLGGMSTGGRVGLDASGCAIGTGPYESARKHAAEELSKTSHLVDEDCDICRIIDILALRNLSLAFAGDSVNNQIFNGFECELRRRGFNVMLSTKSAVRPEGLFWRLGLGATDTLTISIPGGSFVDVRNYFLYLPNPANDTEEISKIAENEDVFVFNFGLHQIELKSDFKHSYVNKWMRPILSQLKRHNFTLLAHRETTAQHFDSPGGIFWKLTNKEWRCVPVQDGPNNGWREPLVQQTARETGYRIVVADETLDSSVSQNERELLIFPYYNFTKAHWDLHGFECTHFCSTPFLWLPIWRSLRLGLERRFGSLHL